MSGNQKKNVSDAHQESSPGKEADENAEEGSVYAEGGILPPSTSAEKARSHFKRRWIWYLAGVIFLVIFLPVFFLVVIPAVAQLVINKSDLVLINAVVAQPNPSSVALTLEAKIDLKIILPVRIEPVTLSLFDREYGSDDAYATVAIAGQTVKGNYTLGAYDQLAPILNMTAWETFVRHVVFQEKMTLSLKGVTNGYLGVLKCHVTIDKDITAPVLNRFDGFFISDSTLLFPAESDGTNLIGNATLPNPTVLTLEVGTLVLDIRSGDLLIGNATLTDVTLRPGTNTFPLRGVLSISSLLKNLPEVLKTQGPALKAGNLSLDAATSSIHCNGKYVPYYTDVLRDLTLTANIGVVDLVKNTIHHLELNKSLMATLANASGRNSTDDRRSVRPSSTKDDDVTVRPGDSNRGTREGLAAGLKRNKHVRDILGDEAQNRQDEIMESLVALADTLYPGKPGS